MKYCVCGSTTLLGHYGLDIRTEGTDTLAYNALPSVIEWLNKADCKTLIAEGDRISNASFLRALKRLKISTTLVVIECAVEDSRKRLGEAGSKIKDSFIKATRTKAINMKRLAKELGFKVKVVNTNKDKCTKYYRSPRWSGEILDCSMPMTMDTYNKCSYNCLYCFSYYQKSHDSRPDTAVNTGFVDYQKDKELTWVSPDYFEKLFDVKLRSQFNDFIREKRVMQWGGLADQFDEYERQKGKTLELLQLIDKHKYPLSFSTKATWFTKDERYMDLIKQNPQWHFKISIINLDEKKSRKMEMGVDTPMERLKAIKRLSDLGNPVTLRLRPFIVGFTNENNDHLKLIRLAHEHGADSISTEFFCLEQRADKNLKERYKKMSDLVGLDILKYYREHSSKRGYLRLNYKLKQKYIDEMKALCDELGMRFYVSYQHHKEKSCNGSCCGLPEHFNYSRGQFTEALLIAKEKGKVQWRDIKKDLQTFKKFPYRLACEFNTGGNEKRLKHGEMTMYDYIKNHWNNPNMNNSPYKYFEGLMYPIGTDEENNVIYEYKPKKS